MIPDWLHNFIARCPRAPGMDSLSTESTVEEAGFDAIALVEIDCLIEERTGRYVDHDEIEAWNTLGDIVASERKCRKEAA